MIKLNVNSDDKFYKLRTDNFNNIPYDCEHCAYAMFMCLLGYPADDFCCNMVCDGIEKQDINKLYRGILYNTLVNKNGTILYIGNVNYSKGGLPS